MRVAAAWNMIGTGLSEQLPEAPPPVLLQSVIVPGSRSTEGQLIESIAIPWFDIIAALTRDNGLIYQLDWRKLEEIVGAAYHKAGFTVTITPRSNDGGRDIIAERADIGYVRFIDQAKRYAPTHLVDAEEVRAMLGVLSAEPNTSKGLITTTSGFAPGIARDLRLAQFMPNRLELRDGPTLLKWLQGLAAMGRGSSL
jgi:restriction system protein